MKLSKQFVAQLIVTAGVLLNLAGILLQSNPHVDANVVHGLTGAGLGVVLVGVVAMIKSRKAAG